MMWHRIFHLIEGFGDEHFRHISGFMQIYAFIVEQFGQSTLKKFFVSMNAVGITKKPRMSLYYFYLIGKSNI